jgi:glycosyltransferase involved in cell wall biosynthesis
MAPENDARPAVSVVLCTFNRSALLVRAIEALLHQKPGTPSYEVVIVDNKSTDDTREIVERFLPSAVVRYEFEERPGLSFARNHGVARARADILAFTDDDVRVDTGWIESIAQTFQERPAIEMAGGKVRPEWEESPPSWLAATGTGPLALVDYGDRPFEIGAARPVCLIGANVAVRRRAFDRVGGFSTRLQRVGEGIGSTEDHDFQVRVIASGGTACYEPRITVRAVVPRERLSKRYHRAWHQGHGRFYALMRDPSFESSSRGTLLGVPAHIYRSAVREGAAWVASVVSRRSSAAFAHELQLRFLAAFAVQRMCQRTGS